MTRLLLLGTVLCGYVSTIHWQGWQGKRICWSNAKDQTTVSRRASLKRMGRGNKIEHTRITEMIEKIKWNILKRIFQSTLFIFQLANIRETKSSNKSAIQFFDAVLQQPAQGRNIEALFGKVILYWKFFYLFILKYLKPKKISKFHIHHLFFFSGKILRALWTLR